MATATAPETKVDENVQALPLENVLKVLSYLENGPSPFPPMERQSAGTASGFDRLQKSNAETWVVQNVLFGEPSPHGPSIVFEMREVYTADLSVELENDMLDLGWGKRANHATKSKLAQVIVNANLPAPRHSKYAVYKPPVPFERAFPQEKGWSNIAMPFEEWDSLMREVAVSHDGHIRNQDGTVATVDDLVGSLRPGFERFTKDGAEVWIVHHMCDEDREVKKHADGTFSVGIPALITAVITTDQSEELRKDVLAVGWRLEGDTDDWTFEWTNGKQKNRKLNGDVSVYIFEGVATDGRKE